MIVYISIGNSDDKLGQAEWAVFHAEVAAVIRRAAHRMIGAWVSPSTDPWQNACWCIEIAESMAAWLGNRLENLALAYKQDSIAWAEAPTTVFLGAA